VFQQGEGEFTAEALLVGQAGPEHGQLFQQPRRGQIAGVLDLEAHVLASPSTTRLSSAPSPATNMMVLRPSTTGSAMMLSDALDRRCSPAALVFAVFRLAHTQGHLVAFFHELAAQGSVSATDTDNGDLHDCLLLVGSIVG